MQYCRRNNLRYAVTGNGIVVMATLSNNEAAVRDIGPGGMKLQYMSEKDRSAQWTQINISSYLHDFFLITNVHCKVVYDIKGIMENGTFRGKDVRLCGLCFREITKKQEIALQRLLDGYSID